MITYAFTLTYFAVLAIVHGVVLKSGSKHSSLRKGVRSDKVNQTIAKVFCPGTSEPCNGHGECESSSGTCWCATGWGSYDCSEATQSSYEIPHVNSPDLQDMIGTYDLYPMYLPEEPGAPADIKFIAYDPIAKGWAISRLNSSCTDDICFFAYGNTSVPPPKGYVYGQPQQHVYYRQLVYDDTELFTGRLPGYHMIVGYSPDPNDVDTPYEISQFTGRYVLQPRYVHRNGRFAIMPVSLYSPGKLWIILALAGQGPTRGWYIVAQAQDPTLARYKIPKAGWGPSSLGITVSNNCQDQLSLDACGEIAGNCNNKSPDSTWIRACCRQTCGTCHLVPSSDCALPKTSPALKTSVHPMLVEKMNRTSA